MTHTMSLTDTLSAFSEWLDGEGLMAPPMKDNEPNDDQGVALRRDATHNDLAVMFLNHWDSVQGRAALAGRLPNISPSKADELLQAVEGYSDLVKTILGKVEQDADTRPPVAPPPTVTRVHDVPTAVVEGGYDPDLSNGPGPSQAERYGLDALGAPIYDGS